MRFARVAQARDRGSNGNSQTSCLAGNASLRQLINGERRLGYARDVLARTTATTAGICVAILGFVAPAEASYTLGAPDLTASPAGVPGSGTLFQESDPGATLTAPSPGVIVAFRARFSTDGTPRAFNFRVMRPELGNRFRMIGSTPSTVPPGPGSATVAQPARTPIEAGKVIGVAAPGGVKREYTSAPMGTIMSFIYPIAGDGTLSEPAMRDPAINPGRMLLNATVEPDADRDGFGDETQDLCPTDASTQGSCPTPPGDTTAPAFLGQPIAQPGKFQVARRGEPEHPVMVALAAKGTTFRFGLSEDATVIYSIGRRVVGRRVNGKCVKKRSSNAQRRKCVFFKPVRGFSAAATAGDNAKPFSGRIGREELRPGRYRGRLVAVDAATNRSTTASLHFQVVRPRR